MTIQISGVQLGGGSGTGATTLSGLSDVSINSPLDGQYLRFNGTTHKWQNSFIDHDVYNYLNTSLTSSGGIVLTKSPYTIDIGLNLPDVNASVGTYGDSTHVPRITVDSKGRITAVSLVTITGGGGTGAVTSFNTRQGDVVLTGLDVTNALAPQPNSIVSSGTATTSNLAWTRNANYIGGTPGYVNSVIYTRTTAGANTTSFEWGITGVVDNYSNAGENVGIYGQGNKYSTTGPTWGMVAEARDHTGNAVVSNSGGLVGLEVDVFANGDDTLERRIGIDVVVGPGITGGAKGIAYDGVRVGATNNNNLVGAFKYAFNVLSADNAGLLLQNTGTSGILSKGAHTVGIDLSQATHQSSALKIKSGDRIALDTDGNFTFRYNVTNGYIEFFNGSTRHGYINITSGADVDFASGGTSTGTVTSLSINTANGFAGSVANSTTTPAVTLSTNVVGVVKADGTAISAATAGTDYVSPTVTTNFTALQTFSGSSTAFGAALKNAKELTLVISAAPSATQNIYISQGASTYFTVSATTNWTFNIAFSSSTALNSAMSINDTVTVALITTQGSTAYYPSVFQIDGTTITPKWLGATAPSSGNASSVDVYHYTITKIANSTYTVLASQSQYK